MHAKVFTVKSIGFTREEVFKTNNETTHLYMYIYIYKYLHMYMRL